MLICRLSLTEHVMTSKKQHESPHAATQTPAESDDNRLDEALEESFPASDPVSAHHIT